MNATETGIEQLSETDDQRLFEQLPEHLQAFCKSGQSVADLAHLVKNIIQMVSGSVEIMDLGLERKQYDRVQRSWTIFESNFFRLKKFVLDLIKYTKHYPLQKSACDLNQIIQRGIRTCEWLLKDKHIKIKLTHDKTLPHLQADADRLEEIIINLILHSLDNLDNQPGEITIHTHYVNEQECVQIDIHDDGPMLSEDACKQLTEPFERARNMTGTGFEIPLSIAYCRRHKGTLQLNSSDTGGNCVSIRLPIG